MWASTPIICCCSRFVPPGKLYPAGKDVLLHSRLDSGFAAVPGVERVAPGTSAYISQSVENSGFLPEGEAFDEQKGQAELFNIVGNDFFQTMGIPMVAGRSFRPAGHGHGSPKVGIINQALARKRFPNVNPIGKRFKADDDKSEWIQIVGICKDTHYSNLRDEPPAQFFMPFVQQAEIGGMTYQIRTKLEPASLVPALRRVVQSADRDLPMIDVRTQQEQIDATMQIERAFSALTSSFGVLALALACVGIYGIMAHSVANRRNEIGIRMALGAQPKQVRGMILRESTWLAAARNRSGSGGGAVADAADQIHALRNSTLRSSGTLGGCPVVDYGCDCRELDSGTARGKRTADGCAASRIAESPALILLRHRLKGLDRWLT